MDELNCDPCDRQSFSSLGLPGRPFFYPLSSLPAYKQEDKYKPLNPIAYDICSRGINLPSALNITENQIEKVSEGIKKMAHVVF